MMRRAKPGRRINKRHENEEKVERDDEIAKMATGLEEYIVFSDSSSVSRSSYSSSSSVKRSLSSSSSTSESSRSSNRHIVKPDSITGSGGSRKSLESGGEKEKKTWKMDDFYRIYSFKEYISSYLYLLHDGEWIKVYGSINGENLRVLKVPDTIAIQTYEPEPTVDKILSKELSPSLETLEYLQQNDPIFIYSIKDAVSLVFPHDYKHDIQPLPPIPYTCFFRIDKYIFSSSSYISANSWVQAARLSAYEYGLLNVYFSFSLLRVVPYIRIWSDFEILPFKTRKVKNLEWDGECRIKFHVGKEWSRFYCKVSSAVYETPVNPEDSSKTSSVFSKFFHGKKSQSNEIGKPEEKVQEVLVRSSQMAFYSSALDCKKGVMPRFIVKDVIFVYALWPKTMHHIKSDAVNEIKIMGNLNFFSETDPSLEPLEVDKDLPPSAIFLQSANTHESLHWLVAILGAFALNADINSSDTNSAVWSSPPSDWGELCLVLDEVAGLSGSVPLSESFTEYAKLLSAKKGMLRNGIFSDWKSSVRESIQTRQHYERKEVELKANALILWIDKLKNGEVQLPNWVKNELNEKIGEENATKQSKYDHSDSDSEEDVKKKITTVIPGEGKSDNDLCSIDQNGNDADNKQNDVEGSIIEENGSSTAPSLRRVSSSKREAAKKFLIGLSESLPKMFDRTSDLPSSVWYQEEKGRIKVRGERVVSDHENSTEDIPIYEANSLLEKEAHSQKKSGLENFYIPEKQIHIFAENSLLEKTAVPRASQSKTDGPLLGPIQKDANKPKLEGGLLGQLDLREKEYENFRKAGGYRATMLPQPADTSQIPHPKNKMPEYVDNRDSSISLQSKPTVPEIGFAGKNAQHPLNSQMMIPPMDPRSSFIQAPLDPRISFIGQQPLDHRMSFIGQQPLDPRMSFIGHPHDPRMSFIGPPLDPRTSFIGHPLDPRFSFIPPPIDPRFSQHPNEMNYSNVSSLHDGKGDTSGPSLHPHHVKLNSFQSKSPEYSPTSQSSESENSHGTATHSGEDSDTDSSSNERSSDETSSSETKEALFKQLEDNDGASGSSSVTSSDDDDDSENSSIPPAYPSFGQIPYPGVYHHPLTSMHALVPGMPPISQFPPHLYGNFQIPVVNPPNSKSSKSISPTTSGEEVETRETAKNDSGTESDSSLSADELAANKKSRSLLQPGKRHYS